MHLPCLNSAIHTLQENELESKFAQATSPSIPVSQSSLSASC